MTKVMLRIVLISCLAFFSCQQKPLPPNPPVPVNLQTVTAQQVFYYDKYPSTTQALSQVNLIAQVQGYITAILFKEGTHIKKGQELYEIDKRLYQANYDAAVANLKVAQGNTEQAQQDADRYTYLNSQNAVAKQLYDHAIIALKNAKNSEKAAEEALKTAKTNLTYSTIYAPFNGTIGFSLVKLGDMANVGQTVLNTISTDDPMAVDFLINEKQLAAYEKLAGKNPKFKNQNSGSNIQVPNSKFHGDATDSLFTILLPDNSLYPYTGSISVIDRAVDPQTGTIRIRLVFPNPDYSLKAGMSCVVRVHNQESTPQMLIPSKATVEQMGEYFVFLAKDTVFANAADTAQKKGTDEAKKGPRLLAIQKKVQLGETIGPNVIVKGGINDGDKIVVDGVQSLHNGSPIAVGSKPAAGANGNNSDSTKKK